MRLEFLDDSRGGRPGQIERIRCPGEAVHLDHFCENLHCLKPVHVASHRLALAVLEEIEEGGFRIVPPERIVFWIITIYLFLKLCQNFPSYHTHMAYMRHPEYAI